MIPMRIAGHSCLLLAIIVAGCGKRQTVDRSRLDGSEGGYYEAAWVDPQIVISDSLFTLIRAERIDSFYVDGSEYPVSVAAPSVALHVDNDICLTTVNLVNADGEVVRPLLLTNLRRGHYKLTLNLNLSAEAGYPAAGLYLEADFCGTSISQPIRGTTRP